MAQKHRKNPSSGGRRVHPTVSGQTRWDRIARDLHDDRSEELFIGRRVLDGRYLLQCIASYWKARAQDYALSYTPVAGPFSLRLLGVEALKARSEQTGQEEMARPRSSPPNADAILDRARHDPEFKGAAIDATVAVCGVGVVARSYYDGRMIGVNLGPLPGAPNETSPLPGLQGEMDYFRERYDIRTMATANLSALYVPVGLAVSQLRHDRPVAAFVRDCRRTVPPPEWCGLTLGGVRVLNAAWPAV